MKKNMKVSLATTILTHNFKCDDFKFIKNQCLNVHCINVPNNPFFKFQLTGYLLAEKIILMKKTAFEGCLKECILH